MTDCINHIAARLRPAVLTALAAATLLPTTTVSAPRLRCEIDQGGESRVLDFAPVSDPYAVKPIDIGRSFRFKAVVFGDELRIDYIKIYSYYQSARQAVLLHEAKYLTPVSQPAGSATTLTGTHYLYSPRLGREMKYACALIEVAP